MDEKYSKICYEEAMKWYGWGSPIGLGFFFLSIGVCAVLIRYAIVGFC